MGIEVKKAHTQRAGSYHSGVVETGQSHQADWNSQGGPVESGFSGGGRTVTLRPRESPFANRECYPCGILKHQDLLATIGVALIGGENWTYKGIASRLGISVSEAHAAVK